MRSVDTGAWLRLSSVEGHHGQELLSTRDRLEIQTALVVELHDSHHLVDREADHFELLRLHDVLFLEARELTMLTEQIDHGVNELLVSAVLLWNRELDGDPLRTMQIRPGLE